MRSISRAVASAFAPPSGTVQSPISPAPASVTGGDGVGAGVMGPGPGAGVGLGVTVLLPLQAVARASTKRTAAKAPSRMLMFSKEHYCLPQPWCIVLTSTKQQNVERCVGGHPLGTPTERLAADGTAEASANRSVHVRLVGGIPPDHCGGCSFVPRAPCRSVPVCQSDRLLRVAGGGVA